MADKSVAVLIDAGDVPKSLDGKVIETPARFQDAQIKLISAVWAVFIRAFRTFLQNLAAGVLAVSTATSIPGLSDVIPPSEFGERMLFVLYVAGLSALVAAIQRAAEIAAKVDDKVPEWTA